MFVEFQILIDTIAGLKQEQLAIMAVDWMDKQ